MSKSKKGNSFLVQGSILAIASIIVRFIGMLYRVPLTNIIGNKGNSIYDTAYSIYNIIFIISSYSIPLAVSKLLAAKNVKKEYKNAGRILKGAFIYALLAGTLGALICYFGAPIFVDESAVFALRTLAPTVFLGAVLGVLRGFFQAHHTMIPTSVSQIIEQIFNACISIFAAYILVKPYIGNDPEGKVSILGAGGGAIGTGAGVLSALVFCIIVFCMYLPTAKKRIRKDKTLEVDSYDDIFKLLIMTITPVILSAFVYNVSTAIDNKLIYDIMLKLGEAREDISEIHGIYTGKYLLLINVPMAIANAVSSSMIPSVSSAITLGDVSGTKRKVHAAIKFTMVIAIPSAVGLAVLSTPILELIFRNSDPTLAAKLLSYGSIAVFFFALSTVTTGVLQGIGKLKVPVINSAIALLIHIILVVVLLFAGYNVWALLISTVVFAFIVSILNSFALRKYLDYKQEIIKTFLIPLVCAAIMGIMTWGSYYIFITVTNSNIISVIIAMMFAFITYAIAIVLLNGVTEEEMNSFPKGNLIIKVFKKLKLM